MYGLHSLTEHSTLNVEFSRESVSFVWKDMGVGAWENGPGREGWEAG